MNRASGNTHLAHILSQDEGKGVAFMSPQIIIGTAAVGTPVRRIGCDSWKLTDRQNNASLTDPLPLLGKAAGIPPGEPFM